MRSIDGDAEANLRVKVPEWIKAVDESAEEKVDYLIMMLDAFLDDPVLLFNALWYAYSRGVDVLVLSDSHEAKEG